MNGVKNLHTLHNFELNVIEMLPEQRLKNLYSLNKLRVNQKITRAWPLSTHVYTGSNNLKVHSCYVFTVTVGFFLTGLSKQCHIIILSDFLTMKHASICKKTKLFPLSNLKLPNQYSVNILFVFLILCISTVIHILNTGFWHNLCNFFFF